MEDSPSLVDFYERGYSAAGPDSSRYSRWRSLSAIGKADHVIALCGRAGVDPASTLDVGCGDGALLCELRGRGFGGRLEGIEIAEAAVRIAAAREGIDGVALYDGEKVPAPDASIDLGVLSHVLEHVPDPPALLAEVARACRAVVIEVPLEANWSARRASKREHAAAVGHLQRLDRRGARGIAAAAGLAVACELCDPLPLEVHRHFASTRAARMAATAKWAVRSLLHAAAPALAERLFTVHYAALLVPSGVRLPSGG